MAAISPPPLNRNPPSSDVLSIISNASRTNSNYTGSTLTKVYSIKDDETMKVWCNSMWVLLSVQAKELGVQQDPYFNMETGLLSKADNQTLWKQVMKLYNVLGPEKAPYATPKMIEGGEVKWYSFVGEQRGAEAAVYDTPHDAGWSFEQGEEKSGHRGMRSVLRGQDMRGFDLLKTEKRKELKRTVGVNDGGRGSYGKQGIGYNIKDKTT